MPRTDVAFLGPPGTYSQLVARRYCGPRARHIPLPSIRDVCAYVAAHPGSRGVVPIENSSGGAVYEMIDILLAGKPRIVIQEEVALNVRLALLGRKGQRIKVLFSHFVPLEHCATWLKRRLPRVDREAVASTSVAAQRAWQQPHAAALGNRDLAALWNLDILEYPVATDAPNITVFLVIGGAQAPRRQADKITLAVRLANEPGSLCTFLECFRRENVNLSRLLSRPIRGCPREYQFLVDLDGNPDAPAVRRALRAARKATATLRVVGTYPTGRKLVS